MGGMEKTIEANGIFRVSEDKLGQEEHGEYTVLSFGVEGVGVGLNQGLAWLRIGGRQALNPKS